MPAIVVTLPAFKSTARMAWFSVSATKSVSPSQEDPLRAVEPSLLVVAVVEALFAAADRDRIACHRGPVWTIRLWPVSVMKSRLPVGVGEDLARVQQRAVRWAVPSRG